MKFDPDLDFKGNLRLALDTITDKDIGTILEKNISVLLILATENSIRVRSSLIEALEQLIEERVQSKGDYNVS